MDFIEAEKFIASINRDRSDYTKWSEHLFKNMIMAVISATLNHRRGCLSGVEGRRDFGCVQSPGN